MNDSVTTAFLITNPEYIWPIIYTVIFMLKCIGVLMLALLIGSFIQSKIEYKKITIREWFLDLIGAEKYNERGKS